MEPSNRRLKTTETLLGIETKEVALLVNVPGCLKTTETLLGIETEKQWYIDNGYVPEGLKTTETLLGIET